MSVDPIVTEIIDTVESLPTRGPLHAYLFGSALRAEGVWSDIDILLVCETEVDGRLARRAMSDLCARYPIDLVIMTSEEEIEFDFIRSESCRWVAGTWQTKPAFAVRSGTDLS
jgi:predicted nucleotidyltransferase